MSQADFYLLNTITKYEVDSNIKWSVKSAFEPIIKQWASSYLLDFDFSGSTAKGTEVSISSDVDLFVSLATHTPDSLQQIFDSLYTKLAGYSNVSVRKQNVSLGLTWNGHKIDITPGKKHSGNTNDHSLYKNKTGTWTLTNIQRHINIVSGSARINEIKLFKIWRENHQLEWPSIFLELFVIDALKGYRHGNISTNFFNVLSEISNNIENKYILDPSNTNNVISNDLDANAKRRLKYQAQSSLQSRSWGNIVW